MTDEAPEAMSELVWSARMHAVSAACALQTALGASECGKPLAMPWEAARWRRTARSKASSPAWTG